MITKSFIINNIYLILINILIYIFSLTFIIWNQFSNHSKIFKKNNLLGFISSFIVGIIFSGFNLSNLFFYYFWNTKTIIIQFIPLIIITTYFLNIKISSVSNVIFCVSYIIFYFLFLNKNYLLTSKQFLFCMVLILLSSIFTYLFKCFNLKRFYQITTFSIINFVLNQIICLFFIQQQNWLIMFINLVINQFLFISFVFFYKLFHKIIKNIIDLNHLSIYNNEFFLNWNSFLKQYKEFKQKNNLFYVCSIDIKNLDNNLELNNNQQKSVLKKTIFNYLKLNLKSYETIYFMDNFNNYNILISCNNKTIQAVKQDLNNIFKNIICNIKVNKKNISIHLNYSFSIFGIHSYCIKELLKINNRMFEYKNSINFYDCKNNYNLNYYDEFNINQEDIKVFLINKSTKSNVLEISLMYKNKFYDNEYEFYADLKFNKTQINLAKRFIAFLAIIEYNKNQKFKDYYLLCNYPESVLLQNNFNINYLLNKFKKLNFDLTKIILKFDNHYNCASFIFIKNVEYLKQNKIKFLLNEFDHLDLLKIIKPSILKINQNYYHITDDIFYEKL